jgi:hypothetical protein
MTVVSLDTRLDTPPSINRRHPDSGLAPIPLERGAAAPNGYDKTLARAASRDGHRRAFPFRPSPGPPPSKNTRKPLPPWAVTGPNRREPSKNRAGRLSPRRRESRTGGRPPERAKNRLRSKPRGGRLAQRRVILFFWPIRALSQRCIVGSLKKFRRTPCRLCRCAG